MYSLSLPALLLPPSIHDPGFMRYRGTSSSSRAHTRQSTGSHRVTSVPRFTASEQLTPMKRNKETTQAATSEAIVRPLPCTSPRAPPWRLSCPGTSSAHPRPSARTAPQPARAARRMVAPAQKRGRGGRTRTGGRIRCGP